MIYCFSTIFVKLGFIEELMKIDKDVSLYDLAEFTKVLKKIKDHEIIYVEFSKIPEENQKILKSLGKRPSKSWAVLDPFGVQNDPAELFHLGAFDYLGPQFNKQPVEISRLKKALLWAGWVKSSKVQTEKYEDFKLTKLTVNKEYRMFFLLIDLYNPDNLRKKLGEKGVAQFCSVFQDFLKQMCVENGGVLWIQQEFSFLLVFPPSSVENAVFLGLKLITSRSLFSIEKFDLKFILDIRASFHFGTAPWQEPGKTGNVVSDSINSLFHLGLKRAAANTLTFTENCLDSLPHRIKNLTKQIGEFEGRKIYQMPIFDS